MNKGYIIIDGKAITCDENGVREPIEYYDNLDQVLVEENVIEELEKKITNLEKELEQYPEVRKKYIPIYTYALIFAIVLLPFILKLLYISNGYAIGYLQLLFTTLAVSIPIGTVISLLDHYNYKIRRKIGYGILSKIRYLKKQIGKEKEIIESLKKDKTINLETKETKTVKINNDKSKIEDINQKLDFYNILGNHEDELYKYYQQGTLDKKIEGFSDEEQECTKEYLKENGPRLSRKLKG